MYLLILILLIVKLLLLKHTTVCGFGVKYFILEEILLVGVMPGLPPTRCARQYESLPLSCGAMLVSPSLSVCSVYPVASRSLSSCVASTLWLLSPQKKKNPK